MRLLRLQIRNFRGFEDFELTLDGHSIFLIGENAGGKSSLLTAIARAVGRERSFSRADFRDISQAIEITATLGDLDADQRAALGNHVAFATGSPATLRVQARAVWDAHAEEAEVEHLYPKDGQSSRRAERDAIPLLWLSANRDASRVLQFGSPRNLMGSLIAQLPLGASTDDAIAEIREAGERFAADAELRRFLDESTNSLAGLIPDVASDVFQMGAAAVTGRDLLGQFELMVKHLGQPVAISQQSSGLGQLAVFVFAVRLSLTSPGSIFLIDEPELSLHPQVQRALVRTLRALESQTVIATHSASLLERGDPRRVARVRRSGGTTDVALPSALSDDEAAKFARFTNPHAAEGFFARTVVLVEGDSDRLAIEALAEKNGRDLDAEGVTVVPLHGASNATTYITLFGPSGFQLNLAGLYDDAEERLVARGLEQAGLVSAGASRTDYENVGFFACVADLEDELIRALGRETVESVIADAGDDPDFRRFQSQAPWDSRAVDEQLRGFIAGRKVQYAPLLVDALTTSTTPAVLAGLLQHV